jgi:hypothetical protein
VLNNCNAVTLNQITASVPTTHCFKKVAERLDPGWYSVHGAQYHTEHCFALRADVYQMHQVIDAFEESKTPPCHLEPLETLQWIDKVYTIRRVNPTLTPYKPRYMRNTGTQKQDSAIQLRPTFARMCGYLCLLWSCTVDADAYISRIRDVQVDQQLYFVLPLANSESRDRTL